MNTNEKKKRKKIYAKRWIDKNKDKIKAYNIRFKKEVPWYVAYHGITSRCGDPKSSYYKRKNFLTVKDLKYLWYRDKAYLLKRPSIDQRDNNGHYTLKNCHYIEFSENCSKDNHGRITRKTPVIQLDINGNKIKQWDYMSMAARKLRVLKTSISNCVTGRTKTAGGFKWTYA